MQLLSDIPQDLMPAAEAAVDWINRERGSEFRLTGLADSESALLAGPRQTFELGLVLCEGELCAREQVRVMPDGSGFQISLVEQKAPEIPALLDPPLGVRGQWLDAQLAKHDFVLLLFYRGRW